MRAENRLASAFEEFILPYDALRTAAPDAALLELHKGESDFAALPSPGLRVRARRSKRDTAGLIAVLQTYAALPSLPVSPERQAAQTALLGRMNKLRSELLPPVWSRTAQVQQAGLPPQ